MKAAFVKIEYTPPSGQRFGRLGVNILTAEGVKWPLFARLAVFDSGSQQTAICVLDQGMLVSPVVADIRQAVVGGTGLAPEHVMVAATHTHTMPHRPGRGCLRTRAMNSWTRCA